MPLSTRRLAIASAYVAMLEKLVPRLERSLYNRLERLEAKVTIHESRTIKSAPRSTSNCLKKPRRPLEAELSVSQPSVILLGARLRSDREYCRHLIHSAAAIIRAGLTADHRRKHVEPTHVS
jgi:hypothetical protein